MEGLLAQGQGIRVGENKSIPTQSSNPWGGAGWNKSEVGGLLT